MKIGYSSHNIALDISTNRSYRLNAYTDARMAKTLDLNIGSLYEVLRFNGKHGLGLFHPAAGFIPFATTHLNFDWVQAFAAHFVTAGNIIRQNDQRLFVYIPNLLINSPRETVLGASTRELLAYASMLDAMQLDLSHRIGISVGGVFGDKKKSMRRFITNFEALDPIIRRRLSIVNDRDYSVRDCMIVHDRTGLPVVFDHFWHLRNTGGEGMMDQFIKAQLTWNPTEHSHAVVLYLPEFGVAPRAKDPVSADVHTGDFVSFYQQVRGFDFDLLVLTERFEAGALKALALTQEMQGR